MKRIAALLLVISLGAHADTQATNTAEQISYTLKTLAGQSLQIADDMAFQGSLQEERQWDRVADKALELSLLVHRDIFRALKKGDPLHYVGKNMKNLEWQFDALKRELQYVQICPPSVEDLMRKLQRQRQRFTSLCEGGGPGPVQITASCTAKTGGNFFKPKTHMECTVYGRGARGFEVVFNGAAVVHGTLKAQQPQQSFSSPKAEVGYGPGYKVYILTRSGQKVLVAERNPRY